MSLPEVPLLAVLPGTGGLTRVVDKRKVRRDRADFFCTLTEGIRGKRAVDWKLVDEIVPRSKMIDSVKARAPSSRPSPTVPRTPGDQAHRLKRDISGDAITYGSVTAEIDRERNAVPSPCAPRRKRSRPTSRPSMPPGDKFWPLAVARELDDLILHLRTNEPVIGLWVLETEGDRSWS